MFKILEKALGRGISQKFEGGVVLACVIAYSALITHHSIPRTQQSEWHILGHCYASNETNEWIEGSAVIHSLKGQVGVVQSWEDSYISFLPPYFLPRFLVYTHLSLDQRL